MEPESNSAVVEVTSGSDICSAERAVDALKTFTNDAHYSETSTLSFESNIWGPSSNLPVTKAKKRAFLLSMSLLKHTTTYFSTSQPV